MRSGPGLTDELAKDRPELTVKNQGIRNASDRRDIIMILVYIYILVSYRFWEPLNIKWIFGQ